MLGPIIVFVVAVLIVCTYMAIVHKFLRSAEEPGDFEQPKKPAAREVRQARRTGQPQPAH
jgi:hypothetical protein